MSIDKKELSKLSPEQRIRKLKLMEEDRKKEVNEIERMIKESIQELKIDKLAEEVAPEQKPVDISRLFETSGEAALERTARKEAKADSMKNTRGYQAITQIYQDYSQLKEFYGMVSMGSGLTKEQISAIGQIGERISTVERYMTESEKSVSKLDASRMVLYKLKKETGFG